jgi:hypothetical protein
MRIGILRIVTVGLLLLAATPLFAQPQSSSTGPAVPRLVRVTGTFAPATHMPPAPVETITLAIYADETGGTPLWQETQYVAVDPVGRYSVLLGVTQPGGLPADLFASGDARWLGRRFARPGETEQARVLLASVPYALKASDADTLGGRPASAYLLADPGASPVEGGTTAGAGATSPSTTKATAAPTVQALTAGATNYVAKFTNATDLGNSAIYDAGGMVGVNTTTPADFMHVRFTDTSGAFTGYAVQNLGSGAAAYSGTLFYDQNGALGQFQGFNNSTHEYRINNIATSGSINFMLAGASKFLVAPNGNIGIGTTSPSALLEVSNAIPGGPANMWMTSFTNAVGPYYMARRARGTPGAPTAVQSGDGLSGLYGDGYGATAFGSGFAGGITVLAAQNWTDTAHGTSLAFSTTPISSTSPATRMTLDASGNLGIGTTTTPAAGILEVSNATSALPFGNIVSSSFTGTNPGGSLVIGRKARGTSGAPTAVLGGDNLVAFLGQGYGTTGFSGTRGGMFVRAAENWTDAAQGTSLAFNTTPTGTNTPATRLTITPSGDVGIGTANPFESVEIVRNGEANFLGTSYNDGDGSAVYFRRARGTQQTPSAVLAGDALGYFGGTGYGATAWGNGAGVIAAVAAENWTDTANGSLIGFATTPSGTTDFVVQAAILSNGNLGLGTPGDVNGIPTATDKLQVFGDVRVGTAGTNGCLKNFAGTGIAGTCSSDRRFKKDITPFGPVLNQLTALQPVHYFWRATEFPERHFGDAQAYGLIAQDVEHVLPELVVTGDDGFKAIDYSKLPLLTIEAVKELKAENDALKDRLAALERLVKEMRTTATNQ